MEVSGFFESAENWPTAVMHKEEDLLGSKQRSNYNVVFYRLLLSCFQESRIRWWTKVPWCLKLFNCLEEVYPVHLIKTSVMKFYWTINLKNLRFTGIEKNREWKLEEWHCLKIKNPLATKSMNCFTLIFGEACELIRVVGRLRFADLHEKARLFSQKSIRELISLFSTLMKNLRCLSCWCWNYSFYTPAAILDFTRSSDIPKSYPSTFDLLKLVRETNDGWIGPG